MSVHNQVPNTRYLTSEGLKKNIDPITGKVIMGRPKGSQSQFHKLARDNMSALFEMMGGVKGMYDWVMSNERNRYAFYVYMWPRLLGVQGVQRPSGPVLTKITNIIVDPRNNYEEVIDAKGNDITEAFTSPEERQQDREFDAVDADVPEVIEGEMPL